MGIIDQVVGDSFQEEHPFGPQEGFAGTLMAVSAFDGHIADEDMQSLFTILGRMKLYSQVPDHKFRSMLDKILGLLKHGGYEKLLEHSVSVIPPELRETVFANSCDIVLADGIMGPEEKDFIGYLMRRLDISGDRAIAIVQVMVDKNKG